MADKEQDETTPITAEDASDGDTPAAVAPLAAGGLLAGGLTGAGAGLGPGMAAAGPVAGAAFGFGLLPGGTGEDGDGHTAGLVEEALAGDGRTGNRHISVTVTSGTVELSGEVESERERRSAEEIVASVPGVREVKNHLTVTEGN